MNKFICTICFEDIGIFEDYKFGLKIKNKTVFYFMQCYYHYSYDKEFNYLTAYYFSSDNDIKKANTILRNSSQVLSYIFTIPIISEMNHFGTPSLVGEVDVTETTPYTKKIIHLHELQTKINKISNNRKELFFQSIKNFCSGLKYMCMNSLDEEAFMNFFKVLEVIAKNYFELNKDALMNFHPNEASPFLKKFIFNKASITYSPEKIDSISGDFKNFISNQLNDTYSKISLFANRNNIKFNESELNKIVKIRNKIAHGSIFSNTDIHDYMAVLHRLSKEFISKYFLRTEYKKITLDAKADIE